MHNLSVQELPTIGNLWRYLLETISYLFTTGLKRFLFLTIPACERLQDDTHNIQFVVIQGKQTIKVLNNL